MARAPRPGRRGLLITLEGGEGAGKTTQVRLLAARLAQLGLEVEITRQPGGTSLGSDLRKLLLTHQDQAPVPQAELFLYLADRAQHAAQVIVPALEAGRVVLCDRYADSSEVYQGRVRGLGLELVHELNQWILGAYAWPDRTLLLDLDPAVGLGRVRRRGDAAGPDRLESEDLSFHQSLREAYLAQAAADPARFRIIPAHQEPAAVAGLVWAAVETLVQLWKSHAP
ncbi:MAG: dTMP kinase [Deltaproteobacteria bacterium]|nr:dTMP kinase [Deltaproteobacteria bacterium]